MQQLNEDLFEFMKDLTRKNAHGHVLTGIRDALNECYFKACALRDEPLLEPEQRTLINEICDKLSMIERLL